jgi:glutamate 5-kinase
MDRLQGLVDAAASAVHGGREIFIISSGAVGLGREALQMTEEPSDLTERQACAAVGQSRLMALYQHSFGAQGLLCAQVLLTEADFDDRLRYLHLRGTLAALLRAGCVPIINENDVVSGEELAYVEGSARPVFSDNDRLAALVASKLDADLLVLLTDVDGIYEQDPALHPTAALLSRVDVGDEEKVSALAGGAGPAGRGGMRSKVRAAAIAARSGAHAIIASGRDPGALCSLLAGGDVGSWFPARSGLPARQRWIAFAAAARGSLLLDEGAVVALRERGASLLAVGVSEVSGEFLAGDVVELKAPGGDIIGRGMVHCSAEQTRLWCAGERPEGVRNHHALVHRDLLVLHEVAPPSRPATKP